MAKYTFILYDLFRRLKSIEYSSLFPIDYVKKLRNPMVHSTCLGRFSGSVEQPDGMKTNIKSFDNAFIFNDSIFLL